ncbi:hypothetical protein BU17DRAFT_86609 [Hysterangium stoloniferum]|nr:hypothetical protein BU17DRAFT_86609 [Hysterangium stoloniferum]
MDINEPEALSPPLPLTRSPASTGPCTILSNATAFKVSTEDWLSQCLTGSVEADLVADFVMDTVGRRRWWWNDLTPSDVGPINNATTYRGRWWLLGRSEAGGEGGFMDGKKARGKTPSLVL